MYSHTICLDLEVFIGQGNFNEMRLYYLCRRIYSTLGKKKSSTHPLFYRKLALKLTAADRASFIIMFSLT